MKIKICFLFLLTGFILFGVDYPDWFLNPPKSQSKIYTTGTAKNQNEQLSLSAATSRARNELARIVQIKVETLTRDYFSEVKSKGEDELIEFSQNVSKQIADATLENAKIEKKYIDNSTNPKTFYVMVSLKISDLKDSVDNAFRENKNYSTFNAEKNLEKLIDEIKGSKTNDFIGTQVLDYKESESEDGNKKVFVREGSEPYWIKKFPKSDEYYTGIGHGKTLQQSQDAAINTLVSQIKVKIESEINDFMKETNGVAEEDVNQNIKLTVKEIVDGLELVDLYQSKDKTFWAYYRLNILEYQKKQNELMENAKINAFDFLKKSDMEMDPSLSLKYAFTGFYYISRYATKAMKTDYNGKEIIIQNELIDRIQKHFNKLVIVPASKKIEISQINVKPFEVKINISSGGIPVKNMNVSFFTVKGNLDISKKGITDYEGNVSCIINRAFDNLEVQSFVVKPDFISFLKGNVLDDETKFLIERIVKKEIPYKEIPVKVKPLVFSFRTVYKSDLSANDNYKAGIEAAAAVFKNTVIKKINAKFTDSPDNFLMMFEINGNIRQSQPSGQFFSRITVTLRIIDLSTNEEIFANSTPEIKGGSITDIKSLQAALNIYLKEYNEEMVDKINEVIKK